MKVQQINDNSIIKRNNNILTNTIEDEIVMMSLEKGNYYGMNNVGSRIWELTNEPKPVNEICNELMNEYEIDRESCLKSVIQFLEKLSEANLIEIS